MADIALLPVPGWWRFLRAVAVPRATGEADRLVLSRTRDGDEAAFADVTRRYDHRLRSLAYRLLGDRSERNKLAAALARLPHDERAALMLVDAYGLDYAEAVQVIGLRVGTVRSPLSSPRTALRASISGTAA